MAVSISSIRLLRSSYSTVRAVRASSAPLPRQATAPASPSPWPGRWLHLSSAIWISSLSWRRFCLSLVTLSSSSIAQLFSMFCISLLGFSASNKVLSFCSQNSARYYLQLIFIWTVKNIKSADWNRNTLQIGKPSNSEQPIRGPVFHKRASTRTLIGRAFKAPALGVRACTLGDH